MLSFFRRIINSKAGIVVTFIVLGVIALAFAAGDITGLAGNGTSLSGNSVATVGGQKVTATELPDYIERMLRKYQDDRTDGETFAAWVRRADEALLK